MSEMTSTATQEFTISTAIIDNDPLALYALEKILEQVPHIHVIWTEKTGKDGLIRCLDDDESPDVLLVDMSLSDMSGPQVCERIRRNSAIPKILAITSFPLNIYAQEAASSGAQGIVAKEQCRSLAMAIIKVSQNRTFTIQPDTASSPILFETAEASYRRLRKESDNGYGTLSYLEMQVLDLLSQGYSTKQIAKRLGIKPVTVRTHSMNAKLKLQSKTTGEALVKWNTYKNSSAT